LPDKCFIIASTGVRIETRNTTVKWHSAAVIRK